jgi:hypothetical protein
MSWTGLRDHTGGVYSPAGLGRSSRVPVDLNSLLATGSLVLQTTSDPARGPQALIRFAARAPWASALSLTLHPDGRLVMRHQQGAEICETTLHSTLLTPAQNVLITYTWNAPQRSGLLSLDVGDTGAFFAAPVHAPLPLSLRDAVRLMADEAQATTAPGVTFAAIADHAMPHGVLPSLHGATQLQTARGQTALRDLKTGDLVLAADGTYSQVRWTGHADLPARGRFAPVTLRAPYHGARADLHCAAGQTIQVSGSEVEYLFATDRVALCVGDLDHGVIHGHPPPALTTTYYQFLLDDPTPLAIAGLEVDGLDPTLLHNDPALHAHSLWCDIPAEVLPYPYRADVPVLRNFETLTLCNLRAA